MTALLLLLMQVERGTAKTLPLKAGEGELGELARQSVIAGDSFGWELEELAEREGTREYALRFPSPKPSGVEINDTVHAKYWRPRGRGPFPAFVLLHWTAGNFGALETFCARLADNDVAAVMVWMPYYGKRRSGPRRMLSTDLAETMEGCAQASADARRAGHWLHGRAEVNPDRVGILGVSLGAFIAASTAGVDDQFDLVAPVIGGGDLAGVLMHDSKEVRQAREELLRRGITIEALRKELRPMDPVTWAARVPKERVLMVNMKEDEVVPRACTEALWKAYGEPPIRWYPGGHYHVVAQIGNILWDVTTFARPVRWY